MGRGSRKSRRMKDRRVLGDSTLVAFSAPLSSPLLSSPLFSSPMLFARYVFLPLFLASTFTLLAVKLSLDVARTLPSRPPPPLSIYLYLYLFFLNGRYRPLPSMSSTPSSCNAYYPSVVLSIETRRLFSRVFSSFFFSSLFLS